MSFSGNKTDAAQFVKDTVLHLKPDSLLITITTQDSSGVFSVSTATATLSVDTVKNVEQLCSRLLTNTSLKNTPDG